MCQRSPLRKVRTGCTEQELYSAPKSSGARSCQGDNESCRPHNAVHLLRRPQVENHSKTFEALNYYIILNLYHFPFSSLEELTASVIQGVALPRHFVYHSYVCILCHICFSTLLNFHILFPDYSGRIVTLVSLRI